MDEREGVMKHSAIYPDYNGAKVSAHSDVSYLHVRFARNGNRFLPFGRMGIYISSGGRGEGNGKESGTDTIPGD